MKNITERLSIYKDTKISLRSDNPAIENEALMQRWYSLMEETGIEDIVVGLNEYVDEEVSKEILEAIAMKYKINV
jgi:hypothetical protein